MRLDERTARRIARGRFSAELKKAFSRVEAFKQELNNLPAKRHARLRGMADAVRRAFGRLALRVSTEKRQVTVLVLLINDDLSADLSLLSFFLEAEPTNIVLAHIANHAVARLMERKLNVDPVDAIRAEINDTVVNQIIGHILQSKESVSPVPYGTEVKTPTGRFRVSTEIGVDGRVGLTLPTWVKSP